MALRLNPTMGNDLTMAVLIVAIVALMILPLPTALIDTLLAINIAVSVLLLMTTRFIPNAVSLSTFPSLLLFTTLFRRVHDRTGTLDLRGFYGRLALRLFAPRETPQARRRAARA